MGLIENIVKHGKKLCSLELDFLFFDNSGLFSKLLQLENLVTLTLSFLNQSNFKTEDLLTLVDNCKNLSRLKFFNDGITEDILIRIINMKKDTLKEFYHIKTRQEILKHLANCPKLEDLSALTVFDPVENLFSTGSKSQSKSISKMKKLKSLQIGVSMKTEDVIEFLPNLSKLEFLHIFGVEDAIYPILKCLVVSCPNLKKLEITVLKDTRKDFLQTSIKIMFDKLTELQGLEQKS